MEAAIYNQVGQAIDTITLPKDLFDYPWSPDLVHQVVTAMQANRRAGTAAAKDRSQISGGGRKPWRQKGTGRARHGSIRSPIWVGGGVTHGPNQAKKYDKKLNKKAKRRALQAVLSAKWKDGEIIFVDQFTVVEPKTKLAADCLAGLADTLKAPALTFKTGNRALIVSPKLDPILIKSFANLPQVATGVVGDINPLDLLRFKYLIITKPDASLTTLTKRLSV